MKNKTTLVTEIDHQRLSNIVHFYTYTNGKESLVKSANDLLKKKFKGKLLPYKPEFKYSKRLDKNFSRELVKLHKLNMLKNDTKNNRIIIRGMDIVTGTRNFEIGEIKDLQIKDIICH